MVKLLMIAGGIVVVLSLVWAVQACTTVRAAAHTPSSGGARLVEGRFRNVADPQPEAGLLERAGLFARKIGTSLAPRTGAAGSVPFEPAALQREPSVTWIGHATLLARMDGVTFLTDPMFSQRASPVDFAGPKRHVPPGVPLAALPRIDFAVISHNHYDHADLASVRALAQRDVLFFVPLGMGWWVRDAGGKAVELDWWQHAQLGGVRVHCVPAQHFSGRSLTDRDRTLWCGWVVSGPTRRFYHAGDTGYSPDFGLIAERLGAVDLAAVPIGAYSPGSMMRHVHTTPEEALRIGLDVRARTVMGMHFGTFDLADEPLAEPPARFRAQAQRLGLGHDRAWLLDIGETRTW